MHGGVRVGEGYALLIQTHEVAKTAFNEWLTLSERSWLNLAERHSRKMVRYCLCTVAVSFSASPGAQARSSPAGCARGPLQDPGESLRTALEGAETVVFLLSVRKIKGQ